jgi:cytochrome P450
MVGHETTANVINMTLWQLAAHPDIQVRKLFFSHLSSRAEDIFSLACVKKSAPKAKISATMISRNSNCLMP